LNFDKKPAFRKRDFNYLRGTECWDTVKDLHALYNESWTSIREQRAEVQLELLNIVDLMEELDFDPFYSGDNRARSEFLRFMQTPYENGS